MKIDGKKIAQDILENLKKKIEKLKITPKLAIILVGNDPASMIYVNQKKLKAEKIGAKTTIIHLSSNISEANLIKTIQQFNNNSNIHGIIVQQPLPKNINAETIIQAIDLKKDIDGFNPKSGFEMPIALAVLKILQEIFIRSRLVQGETLTQWLKSKNITVIGKGETGGNPIIKALKELGIQPLIIDTKTEHPENLTKNADIIISAVGKFNVVKPEMIKEGIILISVGLHKEDNGKLHGDYEEDKIKNIASFYTPTPGGIGPLNVAMLLKNLVESVKKDIDK